MTVEHIGRRYGPFTYEVGAEKIREFARALAGAIPSPIYPSPPPPGSPLEYFDASAAAASAGGQGVIAPPTFCVNFAMKPFVVATVDPELKLDLSMLVHGEQALEFGDPVRAGDVLTTTGVLTELYEKSGKRFVVVTTETVNQHGRLAVKGTWTAIIRKG